MRIFYNHVVAAALFFFLSPLPASAAEPLQHGGVRVGRAQRQDLHAQFRCQPPGHQRGDQEQAHGDHALPRADQQGEARRQDRGGVPVWPEPVPYG